MLVAFWPKCAQNGLYCLPIGYDIGMTKVGDTENSSKNMWTHCLSKATVVGEANIE